MNTHIAGQFETESQYRQREAEENAQGEREYHRSFFAFENSPIPVEDREDEDKH